MNANLKNQIIMSCRKNVSEMTTAEKTAYVNAVLALKAEPITMAALPAAWADGARNRYDVYVWIHMLVMGGAHNGAAFTPWHREFLRQFELDLQRVSGNADLTIPYWDWITARSISDAGFPFTDDFMGGMGTGVDNRVMTGQFAESAGLWPLNVRTGAVSGPARDNTTYLRRDSGQASADLPNNSIQGPCLALGVYDANPFTENYGDSFSQAELDQIFASFRKLLEYGLHNGPHGWVGGNMMPMTSPNDPVFFLHHCNVDRLWAVWQQKNAGGLSNYQPVSGTPNHSLNTSMLMFTQSFYNFPVLDTPNQLLDHKSLGIRYDTDLPDISLINPTVVFGDVPENSTTYLPIQFNIETCRKIKFRITSIGGNAAFQVPDFITPYEAIILSQDGALQTGEVFIKLNATTGLGSISGMATINAFIEDSQGYYAAAAGDFQVGTWNVNFSANIVERPKSAVCFVLDKSGSMDATDGTSITRFEMLENAIGAARDILRGDDGAGMVYYDTNENRLFDITQLSGGGVTNINNALADPTLIPDGWTAIGKGMIEGADVLADEMATPGTPYSNFAMLVLTDGNENVAPYVSSPAVNSAISGLTNDIYAVGLGSQGSVSDAVLSSISKYMLITGEMQADERLFRLTKYFVQILADISKNDIVVDPNGRLIMGLKHEIAFELTEADMYADVITISPFAPFITAVLVAPNGDVIKGPIGNVTQQISLGTQIYRLSLPALPGKEKGTHAGKWKIILAVEMDIIEKNWKKYAEKYKDLLKRFYQYQSIPYSVIVQTFSDLNLDVTVEQTSKMAGAEIDLYASLRQYKLPIGGRVYADIASPNGDSLKIELQSSKNGFFAGKFKSTTSGIYQIRLRANGRSLAGKRFTRETLRTVSLYKDNPVIPTEDSPQRDASLCAIIDCFLAQKGMREYLQKNHIDPDHLSKCLNSHCMEQFKGRSSSKGKISALGQAEMQMIDRFQSFITAKKDDDIISSVPEMREINYPEAEIPKHSKKALSMPVSPSVKLNEKGKLEIVRFKHKGAAKGKKPSGK